MDDVQHSYRSYVETFQNVADDTIDSWIEDRIQSGTVLYWEPFVQLNHRFQQVRGSTARLRAAHYTKEYLISIRRSGEPIEPYKHQTEAIELIQSGNNTIVSTGIGSGNNFAFGNLIVSHSPEAKER